MFGLGMGELVVVALIVVLLFGSKKLPELGKGVGEAIREFKKAGSELEKGKESIKTAAIKSVTETKQS